MSKEKFFNACINGNQTYIQKILDKELDLVKSTDEDEQTPLHKAAYMGHLGVTTSLLDNGANDGIRIDFTDSNGNSALHLAACTGRTAVVSTLLRKGASPNLKNSDNNTALHIAATQDHIKVIEALLQNSALPNSKDGEGNTALHIAVTENHAKSIKALLQGGAKRNIQNNKGRTAFHLAAQKNNEKILQSLTADDDKDKELTFTQKLMSTQDEKGKTALHLSAERGLENFSWLTKDEAKRNILRDTMQKVDNNGQTSLHLAAKKNYINVIKWSIYFLDEYEYEDDVRAEILFIQDNKQKTALDLAEEEEIVTFLKGEMDIPSAETRINKKQWSSEDENDSPVRYSRR